MWSFISTWRFSVPTVQIAAGLLEKGAGALDACEKGIHYAESSPEVDSVGRSGFLNADGKLELDAAVMDGDTLKLGAVACVTGYEHPVSIARAVLERTPHSILVGAGAEAFARKMDFTPSEYDYLVTQAALERWENDRRKNLSGGHDTIGVVALDQRGRMAAATSTCGTGLKLAGRVGDSPIIGSGLYAQSGVGGAAATGVGEDIMRTCVSFRAVELIRNGISPAEAAKRVIASAHEAIARCGQKPGYMAVVCMNARGECAGAANHDEFDYVYACQGVQPTMVHVESVTGVL